MVTLNGCMAFKYTASQGVWGIFSDHNWTSLLSKYHNILKHLRKLFSSAPTQHTGEKIVKEACI